MIRAAADLLVRRERNPDRAVRNLRVRHQVLGRRHDLGHTRLVIRAEQRQPGRRDDVVAELLLERGVLGAPQHDVRVVWQDQIPSVVVRVDDGADVFSRHFGRRVDVRDEPDDGNVGAGRGGYGRHHVSVFVHDGVGEANLQQFGRELSEQHELSGCARKRACALLRPGVVGDVAEKSFQRRCVHRISVRVSDLDSPKIAVTGKTGT